MVKEYRWFRFDSKCADVAIRAMEASGWVLDKREEPESVVPVLMFKTFPDETPAGSMSKEAIEEQQSCGCLTCKELREQGAVVPFRRT